MWGLYFQPNLPNLTTFNIKIQIPNLPQRKDPELSIHSVDETTRPAMHSKMETQAQALVKRIVTPFNAIKIY